MDMNTFIVRNHNLLDNYLSGEHSDSPLTGTMHADQIIGALNTLDEFDMSDGFTNQLNILRDRCEAAKDVFNARALKMGMIN